MIKKQLGKITRAAFGFGGYQSAQIGLWLCIDGEAWSTSTGYVGGWSTTHIKHDERCEWTEESRSERFAELVRNVNQLLTDAKVESIDKLVGIPVEVTFDDNMTKEWRILKEVL